MRIAGRLTGKRSGYDGHTVEALTPVVPTQSGREPLAELVLLRADVADDGGFTLELADDVELHGPAEISVRAPSGERVAFVQAALDEARLRIAALPQPPAAIEVTPNRFAASLGPVSLTVRIHDANAPERVGNQLVSIWGQPKEAPGEPSRVVLGAAYTDKQGKATIAVERRRYALVEAEVPADRSGASATAFSLDALGLPSGEVAIACDLPPRDSAEGTDADCECAPEAAPRTPGHGELVGSTGVYATDLGVGTCPSPAVPNRTLEEYAFHSLVRTTDPALFGPKRRPERPLSPTALRLASELAYGAGAMDAKLAPRTDESGSAEERLVRPGAGTDPLDRVRLGSEAYRTSGLITARAWRETAELADVEQQILERAASLSEDTLREVLADPDGFTPTALMTAERNDAFETLASKLDRSAGLAGLRKPITKENMPQWDAAPKTYQATTIAHGHILEWRQVWRADGYSLGDLLYSLPLAPGQKREVVVLDWDRQERGIRSESRSFVESFSASLSRDRAVAEIVSSTVTESIRAGSDTNTWGAGGGIGLGIPFSNGFFGIGVAGGGGGSSSTAWQNSARSLGAYAGQHLSDRTQQAAAAVRSQRATVVVGRQQAESVAVTAEVVANHNHCHALTVEYFEVLKHYRMDQELASVRECLFVPLRMTRFTSLKALRWRDTLRRYLREPRLRGGFNAIERIVTGYAEVDFPPGRYADEPVRELSGELRLELDIQRPRPPREGEAIEDYLDNNWNFWRQLFGSGSAEAAYDASIAEQELADQIFAEQLAPRVARLFCERLTLTLFIDRGGAAPVAETLAADFTMVSDYRAKREHLVTFRARPRSPLPFSRAQITGLELGTTIADLAPGSRTMVRLAQISYRNDYRSFSLVRNRRLRNDVALGDPAYMSTRTLSRAEELNRRAHDLVLRDGLLKHLNEFIEHYHQVIWWRMDPNRRFMLLDGFLAPSSGNRSVASVTENRLLSIVGNCLVLPVAPGFALDPTVKNAKAEGQPIDLMEAYRPVVPFPPRRVSVPTRGVHAEAIMGECNSCEITDNTRFWDWASEPTGDEPPGILETSTATRRQQPADTTPSALPAPIVAIQNAPPAPEPTGMSAVTNLLSQRDLFRDVTGLEQNQANALGAFQQAMQTANYFGKLAAGGAKASHANRQGERIMQKLEEAERSGLMDSNDAKAVAGKLFGVMNTDLAGNEKPLPQETSVVESLQSFLSGSGKKVLSVAQEAGNKSQSVDATFDNGEGPSAPPIVDVSIEGVAPVHQVKSLGCWAASVTMLLSHQRKESLSIEAVLDEAGAPFPDKYKDNTGLLPTEVATFMEAFGLRDARIGALDAEALAEQLRQRGPLWVVVDEDLSSAFSVHARVVTGVKGDGTPAGSQVIYNDPATGAEESETLAQFIAKAIQLGDGLNSSFGGYSPSILSL